ncbi:hypothetical protein IWQ60_009882 [Tieghemiomyces parasiticus]|uniref:Uncharacterized protein n=1 Tax=Tieghemiomyces parasiticus TaxID=78921 RepID=A0A9W7ZLJ1_9FUNG|nr:hypothetical protein IWQ60_009882 [Tieghemiomyces parasiticus]
MFRARTASSTLGAYGRLVARSLRTGSSAAPALKRASPMSRSSTATLPRLSSAGLARTYTTDPKASEAETTSTEAETTTSSTTAAAREPEKEVGPAETHEFKAETRQLLDIVAHSLYSEREVFVRELVSNAADALEKLRHTQLVDGANVIADQPLEINLYTSPDNHTFTIQDSGIGMTREELETNLGTIAHSGSKQFIKQHAGSESAKDRIIGQFGVGFYSAFMVGDQITVYTRSATPGSPGYCWRSDGLGSYTIAEAEGVAVGTKIVITLRDNGHEFERAERIREIVNKYSGFVGFPVKLNGEPVNTVEALWKKSKGSVTDEEYLNLYRYLASGPSAHDHGKFMYHLHYNTDAPLAIRSILYVPESNPESALLSQTKPGVNLYSRSVLIQANSDRILPSYLRFLRGVVDSEDIPLNLSRELLQDGALIRRLRETITGRVLKWFKSESKYDPEAFGKFLAQFGSYLKEGALQEPEHANDLLDLLRFPSSAGTDAKPTTLGDYIARAPTGTDAPKVIFYLEASNRATAKTNAYLEAFQRHNVEVLFLYDEFDTILFNQVGKFKDFILVSIDTSQAESLLKSLKKASGAGEDAKSTDGKDQKDAESVAAGAATEAARAAGIIPDRLDKDQVTDLAAWMVRELGNQQVKEVKASERLVSHPAVVVDHQSKAMRQILKAMMRHGEGGNMPVVPEMVTLEVNPTHPVICGLYALTQSQPTLARRVAAQVLDNAMLMAGALNDPITMVPRLNQLLESLVVDAAGKPKDGGDSKAPETTKVEGDDKPIPVVEGEKVE